jgi:hypothetical protein
MNSMGYFNCPFFNQTAGIPGFPGSPPVPFAGHHQTYPHAPWIYEEMINLIVEVADSQLRMWRLTDAVRPPIWAP